MARSRNCAKRASSVLSTGVRLKIVRSPSTVWRDQGNGGVSDTRSALSADGTETGGKAVGMALRLAADLGARLHVVSAYGGLQAPADADAVLAAATRAARAEGLPRSSESGEQLARVPATRIPPRRRRAPRVRTPGEDLPPPPLAVSITRSAFSG